MLNIPTTNNLPHWAKYLTVDVEVCFFSVADQSVLKERSIQQLPLCMCQKNYFQNNKKELPVLSDRSFVNLFLQIH